MAARQQWPAADARAIATELRVPGAARQALRGVHLPCPLASPGARLWQHRGRQSKARQPQAGCKTGRRPAVRVSASAAAAAEMLSDELLIRGNGYDSGAEDVKVRFSGCEYHEPHRCLEP